MEIFESRDRSSIPRLNTTAPLHMELELSAYNIFERDNRGIEIVTDGVKNIIYPRDVHVPRASGNLIGY